MKPAIRRALAGLLAHPDAAHTTIEAIPDWLHSGYAPVINKPLLHTLRHDAREASEAHGQGPLVESVLERAWTLMVATHEAGHAAHLSSTFNPEWLKVTGLYLVDSTDEELPGYAYVDFSYATGFPRNQRERKLYMAGILAGIVAERPITFRWNEVDQQFGGKWHEDSPDAHNARELAQKYLKDHNEDWGERNPLLEEAWALAALPTQLLTEVAYRFFEALLAPPQDWQPDAPLVAGEEIYEIVNSVRTIAAVD